MNRRLPDLPVVEAVPRLRTALAQGCAVLSAPPGSGKTTVIPLALLDEAWLAGQRIVMLEPRRVAARAAAARMASLCGEAVGETVGYQVRFERKVSARTRIEVVTEGLLARRLQADPELPGVGLLIFDEFHERSLDADLALALALDVRANLRPELRILVMSATLDVARVSGLLGDAPVVESGGRPFEVELRYAPPRADLDHAGAVAQAVYTALHETTGDVLAFLPGAREIRGAQRLLSEKLTDRIGLYPLYGELGPREQDAALAADPHGRRKVILATNIAQTSLTVDGVRTVVDGGLVRVARFDLGAGANRLDTERVSRASADQRAGRAGRLGPGVCYRLWSREQQARLPAHDTPEILVADLTRFALELAAWGVRDPATLALLDAPPQTSWRYACELLRELGAIDGEARITAHGRALLRLPALPRRAQMLLGAHAHGLGALACWVAAVLDEREAGSLDLADAVEQHLRERGEPAALRRVREAVRQMQRLLGIDAIAAVSADRLSAAEVARIVAWAYPERIARRRPGVRGHGELAYQCADGGEATLAPSDALAASEWLAIAHWSVDGGTSARRIRFAAVPDVAQLLDDHPPRIEPRVHWDARAQAVVAERQSRLGALIVERKPLAAPAGAAVAAAMCEGVRSLGLDALPWTEAARQIQARVMSLRAWRADEDWPDLGDDALLARLDEWLLPHLDGITRRDHLSRLDLATILRQQLDDGQQQRLDRLAPTHLAVPTGSRIRLDYRPPEPPVLAVKLQEMFGCAQTPTVNERRMPVVLHLLSPAQRPVAVTQDLAGFWRCGYADVRKDLRGRYPKHPWPEDPLAAVPTRRAKPRSG
ncbi:ATP-dependent helicase HrpB [Sinimarinibacterium thermocellulolyticum]|uniref:ATP-dependent helicase HrpB n=1 Tax=Sinimarinibacterium thermocellulolyticum TaxID=3170016 RepID=A0ABV2AC19_9GAMM